jgi:galactokinase
MSVNDSLLDQVAAAYQSRFGCPPRHIVRAPGRVNLIGEHTDYNGGFVLPMAIDRATWVALGPRPDLRVRLHSLDYDETAAFDLERLHKCHASWVEYPKGVAWALEEAGFSLQGWDGVTKCDVPMGAGLSSSAAFELAIARAFAAVSGFGWDASRMALLCQKAENQWVGVQCGIMDQMISALGKQGQAILIDCRDLSTEAVPLPSSEVVVIMDTMTRRDLADSAYNERRAQCEATARAFGVAALRDVSMSAFRARAADLDPVVQRRVRHVISEIERTREAGEAMKRGDSAELGRLMNESHDSLRDDFEVSNAELNAIVDAARKTAGCFGARMTGGGFGGCAIALVSADSAEAFAERVTAEYRCATSLDPKIYICEAASGASVAADASHSSHSSIPNPCQR